MKTNKKAILGMLVAMVISLGVLQGTSIKKEEKNISQIAVGTAVAASMAGNQVNTVGAAKAYTTVGVLSGMSVASAELAKAAIVTLGWTGVGATLAIGFAL